MWIYFFLLCTLGLVFGSFINAWVWRTHSKKSVLKGRSMCPECKHTLAWYDLIPVFSWIGLGGKCRYCKNPISLQYPLVELLTALLFGLLYFLVLPFSALGWIQLILLFAITVLLVAAFVYDARYMLLPEKFMLPAVVLAGLYLLTSVLQFGWGTLVPQLVAFVVAVTAFTALWFFSKGKWLGAGDIRIVAIMGLLLPPKQLLVGLFAAYVAGAVWGVYLIVAKGKGRKSKVPFGPFLIIGLYIGLFFGVQIADWYLGLV
jgi:prepilin signal peptidase PulO-like enzyme (type II secretory pathway)